MSIITSAQLLGGGVEDGVPLPSFYEDIGLINSGDRGQFHEHPLLIDSTRKVGQIPNFNLVISNAHKFGFTSNANIESISSDYFDLIVVDEAHHYPAETWERIVRHFPFKQKLFLTATPENKGFPILPQQDKCVCYFLSFDECVALGIIRRRVFDSIGTSNSNDIFEDPV